MSTKFIPALHFENPDKKISVAWLKECINYYYHNTHNVSLLEGKNISEIEEFASGVYNLAPYKKLFKSAKKAAQANGYNTSYEPTEEDFQNMCIALIPPKINSAIATIQKQPTEISCIALDPLAAQKKEEDLNFLKNKPKLEADLQPIADLLQIDKVDLGKTAHSSIDFGDRPYDLDLSEPDELQVFIDILYQLKVEASFETYLQQLNEFKNVNQYKLLETQDQFKYGISCHSGFQNSMTGLPDIEYEYPGNIFTPCSDLPDYSDNTHRYKWGKVTPLQLFNHFSDEIGGEENDLLEIVNGSEGYCKCNKMDSVQRSNWGTFKMDLLKFEVKSVDSINVVTRTVNGKKFSYFTTEETPKKLPKGGNVWGQNTYCFWWLKNTDYFFGVHKLGFAHRKKGQESYTSFSTSIYKSQQHGAVELAIPENKRAQVAYIKMMHALIMAKPDGMVLDIRGVRNVIEGLKDDSPYTIDQLLEMAIVDNRVIIDTEGFDGKNDGQFKPYYAVDGGMKSGVQGYMQIILDAHNKISQYTGINDALTGQSLNPDALVGVEKLRLNNSLNALYYATVAIQAQYQNLFTNWANVIKMGVEQGGKVKEAIINAIGADKVSIIDGLEDLPLHNFGIKITINQREEERAKFEQNMYNLKIKGVLNEADEYILSGIVNPRDKFKYLAVKEKQFIKRETKKRQEEFANQQQIAQQQGENMVAAKQAEGAAEKELIFAKAEVQARMAQLTNQLGLQQSQFQMLHERQLTQERQQAQTQKLLAGIRAKAETKNQEPLSV